jgi:hypothetical protein
MEDKPIEAALKRAILKRSLSHERPVAFTDETIPVAERNLESLLTLRLLEEEFRITITSN